MLKAYKIEINPTNEQKKKINQTIGVCRFIYNFYIAHNKEIYENENRFVSGMEFSKWLNNEYLPKNEDKKWIKEVSSKAVKQAIMNSEKAFKRFFKGLSGFPNFKKKNKQNVGAYFPKNNKTDFTIERHRIKIPTFGFVRIKEFRYIPVNAVVKSGTISKKADRYFISILVEKDGIENNFIPTNEGLGIDLGLKDFAVCSDGRVLKNINKTKNVKKIERRLKIEQRKLSRKYESLKKKNIKKGEATRQNIQKQLVKVQKLHLKLNNIRTDYINKTVNEIVKTKPSFIVIEDLAISNLMKNRHLSKAIASQKFYEFRTKLKGKCNQQNITLKIADRFYPSSKTCSSCGEIKKDLKLKDRMYNCKNCGLSIDRDLNASINLKNVKDYKFA